MMRRNPDWELILLICILVIAATELVTTAKLAADMAKMQSSFQQGSHSLPCEAIPIRFALAEPDCANRLPRAMNVTNVNFLPPRSIESWSENETDFVSGNRSK